MCINERLHFYDLLKFFYFHSKTHFEKPDVRAGEVAQWLGALVLAEDPGSSLSI